MIQRRELKLTLAELRRVEHGLMCSLVQTQADDIEATVALMVRIRKTIGQIDSAVMANLSVEWVDAASSPKSATADPGDAGESTPSDGPASGSDADPGSTDEQT